MRRLVQILAVLLPFSLSSCSRAAEKTEAAQPEPSRPVQTSAPAAKAEGDERDPRFTEPDIIAALGGRKVKMSPYIVQDVAYTDTPSPFSDEYGSYKYPEPSYENQLSVFGFDLDYAKGRVRDVRNEGNFYEEERQSGTSWVSVSVHNNTHPLDKAADRYDKFLNQWYFRKVDYYPDYRRRAEKPYGLEAYYRPRTDEKTGRPYKNIRLSNPDWDDLFLERDARGHIRTYIECTIKLDVPNPPCRQRVLVRENGLDIELAILHSRHLLHDWKRIEREAMKVVYGFIAAAEADIAAKKNGTASPAPSLPTSLRKD